MIPFRKILFPVDYSETCHKVVPYVRAMAGHYSAQLTLVRAYGPLAAGYVEPPVAMADIAVQVREFEEKQLHDFTQQNFAGADPETILELGDPGTVIFDAVKERGADLVMLPTQGGGQLRRLLLGSVTTKVLHDISAAVWTVAPPALANPPVTQYRSILAAVDTGEEAAAIMVAANAFAKSFGAKLTIVHVVDLPRTTFEVDFGPYLKDVSDAAGVRLRELKATLGIDATHIVSDGNVAEGVRAAATEVNADLLVAGRGHATGGLSRIWSSLYTIVREAPCPVLSI